MTAGTFLGHVYLAVGCPSRNSRRPGLGWCRRSNLQKKKLAVYFGLYSRPRLLDVAQESGLSPSRDVVTPVDMLAIEVTNVQTGVWELRDGRWSKSRVWKFVDVDDLVTCDVYAHQLSL